MINFASIGAIFLGFLAIVVALPATNIDTKKCLQRNGLFPKLGTFCKSYYRCKNWVPFQEECPPGQNFNPSRGWCDWLELFPCLEKKSEICFEPNGKYLKPGTDCKIFYDCCNGVASEKTCPEDSIFDPSAKKCEWPELYTCVESISTMSYTTDFSSTGISTIITTVTSDETLLSGDPFKTSTYPTMSTDYSSSASGSTETVIPSTNNELNTETEFRSKLTSDLTTREYITFTDRFTKSEVTSTSDTYTGSYDRTTMPRLSTKETVSVIPDKRTTIDVSFFDSTTTDKTDQWEETTSIYYETSPSINDGKRSSTEEQITWSTTAGIPEKEFSTRVPDEWTDTLVTDKLTPGEKRFSTPNIDDMKISTSLTIMCPETWGLFPHPTDKHKFINCVNGDPYIFNCQEGLIYNPKKKRCDYS